VIGPLAPKPAAGATPARSPAKPLSQERAALREAAEGFEAIMLRRMLASARASSFAEETPLTGGAMQQFAAMRDEHFADIAASTGAFGFARSIEAQLAQHLTGYEQVEGDS
jgi:flagellar protein FlgJ